VTSGPTGEPAGITTSSAERSKRSPGTTPAFCISSTKVGLAPKSRARLSCAIRHSTSTAGWLGLPS
jgi:hypothetical protein